MGQEAHQTADVQYVCDHFHEIHDRVARHWGRVEVTSAAGEPCVLISKAELESIDRALEIMCELPGNHSVCKELTHIAELCRGNLIDDAKQLATVLPSSFDERGSMNA